MPNLILSLTQEEISVPFVFKTTGIKVFSFEEALFHCFYHWKRSVGDILSAEFVGWVVSVLKLDSIGEKLREAAGIERFSERLTAFLSITAYFGEPDLIPLRREAEEWEKRLEWEKLKEQGDYLMARNAPEGAFAAYAKALALEVNAALLNNAAIALMKQGRFAEAGAYLGRALEACGESDREKITLCLAESYALGRRFDEARGLAGKIRLEYGETAAGCSLGAEIESLSGNPALAAELYEKALAMGGADNDGLAYRLAEVYAGAGMYDRAFAALERVRDKGAYFAERRAVLFALDNDLPAAINCLRQAIRRDAESARLWTALARYHRMDNDLGEAQNAIAKAFSLSPGGEGAVFEQALINKARGETKAYQALLKRLLGGFKDKYRGGAANPAACDGPQGRPQNSNPAAQTF